MSNDIQGWQPGVGRTYTPDKNASWTDQFNSLLQELNSNGSSTSRNKLTSKLIEDGLKLQGEMISVPCPGYSEEQMALLNTPAMQQAIKNFMDILVGNATGLGVLGQSNIQPIPARGMKIVNKGKIIETSPQEDHRTVENRIYQKEELDSPTSVHEEFLAMMNAMKPK